jgi:hypothetical protein
VVTNHRCQSINFLKIKGRKYYFSGIQKFEFETAGYASR